MTPNEERPPPPESLQQFYYTICLTEIDADHSLFQLFMQHT